MKRPSITDIQCGLSIKNATIDVINEYFRPYQPDLSYDSLPITELIESDYYTTDVYDENQDTLQDIADGATPGESKKKNYGNFIF